MQKLFILLILFSSCSKNNIKKIEENYDGPLIEIKDLNTFFTDSAQVRFKLKSELYQVFDEGEEIYPKGLYMDIYSRNSDLIIATFEANHVIKYENENYYKATGNVVLFNIELYWYPNDEKFLTEKFVTIKTGDEIHRGEGMESNQDFSSYEIIEPSGIINIDEN